VKRNQKKALLLLAPLALALIAVCMAYSGGRGAETTPEPLATDCIADPSPLVSVMIELEENEPRMVYLGSYYVTGYDICLDCCGKTDGITASGAVAEIGRTVAASRDIPFGTVLYIDGIGERVVEDRGGAITEGKLDVLCEDHAACYAITGWYDVYIVEGGAS
jgi:3D (Asp-Asp-Asp) domain-containing protein